MKKNKRTNKRFAKPGLWKRFWRWLIRRPYHRAWVVQEDFAREPVFVLGGVTYWQFADEKSIPTDRMIHAMAAYAENERHMDNIVLKGLVEDILAALTPTAKQAGGALTMDVTGAIHSARVILDRLNWQFDPDLIYKLAACVYFTDAEDPYRTDETIIERKAELFRDHDAYDFFLRLPLAQLLPFLNAPPETLANCLAGARIETLLTVGRIVERLSERESENSVLPPLRRLMETLENRRGSSTGPISTSWRTSSGSTDGDGRKKSESESSTNGSSDAPAAEPKWTPAEKAAQSVGIFGKFGRSKSKKSAVPKPPSAPKK